jgi:hypothetical protein
MLNMKKMKNKNLNQLGDSLKGDNMDKIEYPAKFIIDNDIGYFEFEYGYMTQKFCEIKLPDEELIKILKFRGYKVFKEC